MVPELLYQCPDQVALLGQLRPTKRIKRMSAVAGFFGIPASEQFSIVLITTFAA